MFNKNLHLWLPAYIKQSFSNHSASHKPIHILFTIVDHFEPYWNGASKDLAHKRVKAWLERLPSILGKFKDADDTSPKHTFFYPEEEYEYECLNMLKDICRQGFGDVEIHLHHDNDTSERLKTKLISFKRVLYERHGLLRRGQETREIMYGFIHGNWALANSRKDGRWCGVNNELRILKDTGCYADFTMPSAPSETQSRKINSIYYGINKPDRPRSHDTGIDVEVKKSSEGGELMIIQGPLTLNWSSRKWKIFPRTENGDISFDTPPTPERINLWIDRHIHVKGRPEWVIVKVHTHGAQERNTEMFFNGGFETLYSYLEDRYNDGVNYSLHYVSAWELYNMIKAAESGEMGNPSLYRNYLNECNDSPNLDTHS
jgi:hypothetical protein